MAFFSIGFFCRNKRREKAYEDKNRIKINGVRLQGDTTHYFIAALR
jgi:hypothetical protein